MLHKENEYVNGCFTPFSEAEKDTDSVAVKKTTKDTDSVMEVAKDADTDSVAVEKTTMTMSIMTFVHNDCMCMCVSPPQGY